MQDDSPALVRVQTCAHVVSGRLAYSRLSIRRLVMSEKVKRYVAVLLVAGALFCSQLACTDDPAVNSTRKAVGTMGCKNPAARDACGTDTRCRIEACN